MKRRIGSLVLCCTLLLAAPAAESQITPRPFDPPDKTEWVPEGCRAVPRASQVLPSRAAWRNLHSDEINTDEVSIALTPVFAADLALHLFGGKSLGLAGKPLRAACDEFD